VWDLFSCLPVCLYNCKSVPVLPPSSPFLPLSSQPLILYLLSSSLFPLFSLCSFFTPILSLSPPFLFQTLKRGFGKISFGWFVYLMFVPVFLLIVPPSSSFSQPHPDPPSLSLPPSLISVFFHLLLLFSS
jgi:hypothetical protein